jgi:hypothetical protein
MLSAEERQKLRDENPPEVHWAHSLNAYFDWGWKGCGFGQLSFSIDEDTGQITCMNECMSRESVRKILHSLADFIADRTVLLDNEDDVPPIDAVAERVQQIKENEEWEAACADRRAAHKAAGQVNVFVPKTVE